MAAAAPISATEFAALMARLGPFEPEPLLAVAVSGGPDSLALALLADTWVRERGGEIVALTVDHRLRPESGVEAARVGAWLDARGIAHRILVREGPKPLGDIQAAARAARYDLLRGWCRGEGILHLLTAHHRDDQAETVLLRLARGSGADGLAAMAPIVEDGPCRLLRPLLTFPKARLAAVLTEAGQAWVEDTSNHSPVFARTGIRDFLAQGALNRARVAATAHRLAHLRVERERRLERLWAAAVVIDPAGFAHLDLTPLRLEPDLATRLLGGLVAVIGGALRPPRWERVATLTADLLDNGPGGGRTLGGCRLVGQRGRILVLRESAAIAPPVALRPGNTVLWDGRFRVDWVAPPPGATIGALGAGPIPNSPRNLPRRVLPTLPTLRQGDRVVGIPHLDWWDGPIEGFVLRFEPVRPGSGCGFTVV